MSKSKVTPLTASEIKEKAKAKTTTKKENKVVEKKEKVALEKFSMKKVGANIIAIFGSEKHSKKIVDTKLVESILNKGKLYEKKPSDKLKNDIVTLLTPEATKEKKEEEAKEVKVKAIKKQIKKEEKKGEDNSEVKDKEEKRDLLGDLEAMLTSNPEAVDKLQALLNKFKKAEEKKPQEKTTSKPRSGEGYRNY